MMNRIQHIIILAAILPVPAVAEIGGPFDHKFSISVGGFAKEHSTQARLDTNVGLGTEFDLENDLGLEKTATVARIDGQWRFANRHRLNFTLFDLSRDGTATLLKDFQIDDELFLQGETVYSDWTLRLYEVGYSYLLAAPPKLRWWVNAGLFLQDVQLSVQDTADIADFVSEDIVLPLPKVGTTLEWALNERIVVRGGVDAFALKIQDFSGVLLDIRATVDYRFSDLFSLGVGWQYIDIEVDLDKSYSGWKGELDWQIQGLMLFGRFTW
jgi:hypothetical protein